MSPRRSSRARATQPPPSGPQHTTSSSSSLNSLTRAERSTRSHNKNQSPPTSSTQRSQSLEDPDDASKAPEAPQTRQRRRGRDGDNDDIGKGVDNDMDENEDAEAEEVTRCICGQQDYPGPPVTGHGKVGVKDESDQIQPNGATDALTDDPGSFFIQCDSCKVWQHGGCVGIMDEALNPDEYFCEQCRNELHKVSTALNGQKYSIYLPVADVATPRSLSSLSSRDEPNQRKDSRQARQNTASTNTKRRSTMNSRDAAYDEEELIRRAIQESKEGVSPANDTDGNRRGKRGRSGSEENEKSAKRQRIGTDSPRDGESEGSPPIETENDQTGKPSANNNSKKIRGAAARNQREQEIRDREIALEKERADAAGRKKTRVDRRREDSDPSESISPSKQASQPPPPSSQPIPDTAASQSQENLASKPTAHRKTGRPPAKRGRVGRNQYTRDRDLSNGNQDNHHNSPMRSDSRDGDDSHHGANGHNGGETGRPSKPKYMNPHRTTMNEMKRRVAAILEFVSQMKAEVGSDLSSMTTPSSGNSSVGAATALIKGIEGEVAGITSLNGDDKNGGKEFSDLSSAEMMATLTQSLVVWQTEFGKYGDKS